MNNLIEYLQLVPNSPADEELRFMSVEEARGALLDKRGELGGGAYFRRVAACVIDPANEVLGSAASFFNLAMAYDDAGDALTELRVCERALSIYPEDPDLLARAIDAAGSCGRFDDAFGFLDRLEAIPRRHWSHHPFYDVGEFYQEYFKACDPAEIPSVLERAMAVARDYQHYLPTDERGYNLEAELHLFDGDEESARRVLQQAIFGKVQGPDGTYGSLVAAQCCVTMLDRLLSDSSDYDLVIRVARRGIRGCLREQPGARVGYFVYREAMALDGLICSATSNRDGYGNPEKVREALATYRCAYELNEGRETYRDNIRKRYSILCYKSGIHDLPLEPPAPDA